MNNDQLCLLALEASVDMSALDVLGDALQETGWIDVRVAELLYEPGPGWVEAFDAERSSMTTSFATACAAVLLFTSWPTRWWLCLRACRGWLYGLQGDIPLRHLTDEEHGEDEEAPADSYDY